MFLNNQQKQNILGIDIGTKSVRVVELIGKKGYPELKNYGELNLDIATNQSFRNFDQNTLAPSIDTISQALKTIFNETGIKAKKANFSLPDFSTFFVSFELPPMSKKELGNAVGFEARKYIPLPAAEVVLDWQCMSKDPTKQNNKILLMAISKTTINQYKIIASNVGLELKALESEAWGLRRSLIKPSDPPSCLVDIGYQSTIVAITDNNFVKTSYSFDIAGKDLTQRLAEDLGIEIKEAEEIKKENGLINIERDDVAQILAPVISAIIKKIKKVIIDYQNLERTKIQRIILVGGTAQTKGIAEYFRSVFDEDDFFGLEVSLGTPFNNVVFPPLLNKKVAELNLTFPIALGEALKNYEV
ncbi:MAG TPA: pilus assembly protein PilM [Candidatus Paceibacterota bacterium]|nr:pilus assembly protein PilM [Candidatus Pacearchaeota archaeon]HRR94983.1 pilus assembly protein PilM [Candidatus Paceibacterota bacterium]